MFISSRFPESCTRFRWLSDMRTRYSTARGEHFDCNFKPGSFSYDSNANRSGIHFGDPDWRTLYVIKKNNAGFIPDELPTIRERRQEGLKPLDIGTKKTVTDSIQFLPMIYAWEDDNLGYYPLQDKPPSQHWLKFGKKTVSATGIR